MKTIGAIAITISAACVSGSWVLRDVMLWNYAPHCSLLNQCFSLKQRPNKLLSTHCHHILSRPTVIHRDGGVCEHRAPTDLLTQGPNTTHTQAALGPSQKHYRGSCANGCHVQFYQHLRGRPSLALRYHTLPKTLPHNTLMPFVSVRGFVEKVKREVNKDSCLFRLRRKTALLFSSLTFPSLYPPSFTQQPFLSPPFLQAVKAARPVGRNAVSLHGGENNKLDFNTKRIQRFRILFG